MPPLRIDGAAAQWCQCWLPATDDSPLLPAVIDAAVYGDCPTYVHCHLGQNRSTAIAACWIRRNCRRDIWMALEHVIGARTSDLATIGRGKAEISPMMRRNLSEYDRWLSTRML